MHIPFKLLLIGYHYISKLCFFQRIAELPFFLHTINESDFRGGNWLQSKVSQQQKQSNVILSVKFPKARKRTFVKSAFCQFHDFTLFWPHKLLLCMFKIKLFFHLCWIRMLSAIKDVQSHTIHDMSDNIPRVIVAMFIQ